jgi:hypothetical protein
VAEDGLSIYAVPGIFYSGKSQEADSLFAKALSLDGLGGNQGYAINLFLQEMNKNFPNLSAQIDNKNKYRVFVAHLQVPRVSLYKVNKPAQLVDIYLPVTMSINFTNMTTGEMLFSYSYTYYSKYETHQDTLADANHYQKTIIDLYRETYKDLLTKIISHAKDNFHPFTINAKVRKEWGGLYVLDKGHQGGIAKGDVLIDQYGNQLSIIDATNLYSVGQDILGNPQTDSLYLKFSNQSLDEIKKPKVLLTANLGNNYANSVPDNIIYQLFLNALGKKATFSLVSVDKSFFEVQRAVVELTNLNQETTQQRELPDYFLRLYLFGPFYAKQPCNKSYMSYDNYKLKLCGDILDRNGRVLYGNCVDEEITDEVYGDARYSNEAREEVIIKNALIKLADDIIANVKFKSIDLTINSANKKLFFVNDPLELIVPGSPLKIFHSIGKVPGVEESVLIPTWEANAIDRDGENILAQTIMPVSNKVPEITKGDKIVVNLIDKKSVGGMKSLSLCEVPRAELSEPVSADDFKHLSYYAIQQTIKFPFYDVAGIAKIIDDLNSGEYGFKKRMDFYQMKSDFCIESICKAKKQQETNEEAFVSYKYSLVSGLKIYKDTEVTWKKGVQQTVNVCCPKTFEQSFLKVDLSNRAYELIKDISNKIEIH